MAPSGFGGLIDKFLKARYTVGPTIIGMNSLPAPAAHAFPDTIELVAKDLVLSRGGRRVLAGVNFTLKAGETLLVTGPNGAGKSTLLRALAGLLSPAEGGVSLTGPQVSDAASAYAHYVGHAEAQKNALTARENLSFWAALLGGGGLPPEAALGRFGLAHVAGLPFGWLSAGQRRRVSLARLLVAPRPLWLLDEPATALDVAAQAQFAGLMREHLAAGGLIVAATHAPLGLDGARELRLGSAA